MDSKKPIIASAVLLVGLIFFHLIYMHLIARESPVWFNSIFFLQRIILLPRIGLLAAELMSLIFTVWALLTAISLWQSASRLAALLWLTIACWEAYFRTGQLQFAIDENFIIGWSMKLGLLGAYSSLFGALIATFFSIRYHWHK